MSERGGGAFDSDTVASEGSYEAALHAAGGACALVEALVAGEASVGLQRAAPAGPSRRAARGDGVLLLQQRRGGGAPRARLARRSSGSSSSTGTCTTATARTTSSRASREVLFASIHQYPWYPGHRAAVATSAAGRGEGYSINLPVPSGSGEDMWLSLVEHVVVPAARAFEPRARADLGRLRRPPRRPARHVPARCVVVRRDGALDAVAGDSLGVPVGAVLEGGYDLRGARGVVRGDARGAARRRRRRASVDAAPARGARRRGTVGRWWPLPIAGATS